MVNATVAEEILQLSVAVVESRQWKGLMISHMLRNYTSYNEDPMV